MKPLSQLLLDIKPLEKRQRISYEFQDLGFRLANELEDIKHKSLYMKIAKDNPKKVIETALIFVKDSRNPRSKARLFMWKLQELREERLKAQKQSAQK